LAFMGIVLGVAGESTANPLIFQPCLHYGLEAGLTMHRQPLAADSA
jgi:hypothetical protein